MTVWKGLLKKEWKLAKPSMFILFGIIIIGTILFYSLSIYMNEPELFPSMMIGLMFAHVFYMTVILLGLLNKEGETQLWLHNPNSMAKLILAKLIPSFIFTIISLVMTIGMTTFATYLLGNGGLEFILLGNENDFSLSVIGLSSILIGAVYLSLWVLCFWTIYHALARFPMIKNIRWVILIGIFAAVQFLSNRLHASVFYKKIKELWVVRLKGFSIESENSNQSFQIKIESDAGGVIEIFLINWILGVLMAVFLFCFSVWLLERKVEV